MSDCTVRDFAGDLVVGADAKRILTIHITDDGYEAFREAIRRAMNTWQEPPQCIRDLDDIFEFGHTMDNLRSGG